MKKLLLAAVTGSILFSSCADPKQKQKSLLDDIIKSHDELMKDDAKAQMNKLKLDTLLKQKPALKDQITFMSAELVQADSSMEDWMHNFNPDYNGKSNEEVETYLNDQKKKLSQVDAQLKTATQKANQFISQNK